MKKMLCVFVWTDLSRSYLYGQTRYYDCILTHGAWLSVAKITQSHFYITANANTCILIHITEIME